MRILKNQKGQSLIEYVILVALVGVGTMGMVRMLQKTVKVDLANVVEALQKDGGHKAAHERITDEDLTKTDFGNFMNGTH